MPTGDDNPSAQEKWRPAQMRALCSSCRRKSLPLLPKDFQAALMIPGLGIPLTNALNRCGFGGCQGVHVRASAP